MWRWLYGDVVGLLERLIVLMFCCMGCIEGWYLVFVWKLGEGLLIFCVDVIGWRGGVGFSIFFVLWFWKIFL